jgi:predicted lipoprotein with Yx(FWY)xxD motif
LLATGAIHLDLYLTGYRTIPTIGWLFLLQVIAAFGLATVVLLSSSGWAATAGGGFAIATLGGYLLSLRISLFGFREVRTTAGIVAGVVEVLTFAVLAGVVLAPVREGPPATAATPAALVDRLRAFVPLGRWAATGFTVLVAALLGVSLAASSPAATSRSSRGALIKVTQIHGMSVLTNTRGYTLYWFAPDSPSKSACYGSCAAFWPPVIGSPSSTAHLPGKLGTIARTGGSLQATYDGHPLYTYIGDSAPSQATGNDINLNGGLWHEMSASG